MPHWFVVRDLRQTAVNSGEVWILPLSTRGRDFEITRSRLPSGARLVYPAQPDVLQQVDELFDQQSRSRD